MDKVRLIAAILLALPMLVFGGNHFLAFFEVPELEGAEVGIRILEDMRTGGLMDAIAASHVVVGLMLLVPRLRFAGALVQLPLSIGIVAFHATLLPEGTGMGVVLLALNLIALADGRRIARLLSAPEG